MTSFATAANALEVKNGNTVATATNFKLVPTTAATALLGGTWETTMELTVAA